MAVPYNRSQRSYTYSGTKVSGQVVKMEDINEVLLNTARLQRNGNINFNYLLINPIYYKDVR